MKAFDGLLMDEMKISIFPFSKEFFDSCAVCCQIGGEFGSSNIVNCQQKARVSFNSLCLRLAILFYTMHSIKSRKYEQPSINGESMSQRSCIFATVIISHKNREAYESFRMKIWNFKFK